MIRFDRWLISRVKIALDFLFDWFGITQKIVERALIVTFGLSNFVEVVSVLLKTPDSRDTRSFSWQWQLIIAAGIIASFWRRHKTPKAVRMAENGTLYAIFFRYVMFFGSLMALAGLSLACFKNNLTVYETSVDLDAWSFTLFFYVIATDIDGERKSKKLAWSKIKELFGTEWIPQPLGGEK